MSQQLQQIAPSSVEGREQIEDRRRQVYNLFLRGYKPKQISRILAVPHSTINHDIHARRGDLREAAEKVDPVSYLADVREEYRMLREEAWANYRAADKPGDKIKFLKLITKLSSDETKQLQDLGAIEKHNGKSKLEIEADVNVSGQINVQVTEERLEALTALIISQQIDVPPEEALQMKGRDPVFIDLPSPQSQLKDITGDGKALPLPVPHQKPFDLDANLPKHNEDEPDL